jgi:hypothetical protein
MKQVQDDKKTIQNTLSVIVYGRKMENLGTKTRQLNTSMLPSKQNILFFIIEENS